MNNKPKAVHLMRPKDSTRAVCGNVNPVHLTPDLELVTCGSCHIIKRGLSSFQKQAIERHRRREQQKS